MDLPMGINQIAVEYRQAKDKNMMITILADQNCTNAETIALELSAYGITDKIISKRLEKYQLFCRIIEFIGDKTINDLGLPTEMLYKKAKLKELKKLINHIERYKKMSR